MTVLDVHDLTVSVGGATLLGPVSMTVEPGEIHVVLGPSGSGKSTLLRALLGLAPPAAVVGGHASLTLPGGTVPLTGADGRQWAVVRERATLVFQDPAAALTPLRRVSSLAGEVLRLRGCPHAPADVRSLLAGAGFTDPATVAGLRTDQLSGGMAQRLGLALAVAGRPALLLADEPTTALDPVTRSAVMDTLRREAGRGAAVVLVTHDLDIAKRLADRVTELAGEDGSVTPPTPMTRPSASPIVRPSARPSATPVVRPSVRSPDAHRPVALQVEGLAAGYGDHQVLTGLDLTLHRGEVLGIEGPSGSGKSTLLRCLVGLERPSAGVIRVRRVDADLADPGLRVRRRQVQLVPQHPRESLNPWRTAAQLVREPLDIHRVGTRQQRRQRVTQLLEGVGLADRAGHRPRELSTGQCQRLAIARALAVRPEVVVADEPVTALDAHLVEEMLTLFREVVREEETSLLVVCHDRPTLERLSDRVVDLRDLMADGSSRGGGVRASL